MESGTFSWPLIYSAAAVALVIVGLWFFWDRLRILTQRYRHRRVTTADLPPPDTDTLLTPASITQRRPLPSTLFLVAVGTMGARQVIAALQVLAHAGLDGLVGAALFIENDAGLREHLQGQVPAVYMDRVWFAHSEDYAGGFANKPVAWVLGHAKEWAVPIHTVTEAAIDGFFRRSAGRAPALVFVFTSLGGQAPAGIVALAQLADRFGDGQTTLFAAATALPPHGRLRERFLDIKPAYERHGVAGWLLVDNLEDATTADYSVVATLVGHLVASYISPDAPTALNNVLALALTERAGAVLVIEVTDAKVVAFPVRAPDGTTRYYVHHRPLVVQVQRSLDKLAAGHGSWSARLPVSEADTSSFDLVVVPLRAADLVTLRDDVHQGEALQRQLTGAVSPAAVKTNRELSFTALPAFIDPARPICQVICLRLTTVRHGAELVPEIIKLPADRRFVDLPPYPAAGRNGHLAAAPTEGV